MMRHLSLEQFPRQHPIILTIGNFDGVHKGHLSVLERLQKSASIQKAQTCVLTFSNHPSEILRPHAPITLLCTVDHRIKLLKEQKIDHLVLIPFHKELAEQTASTFIENLRGYIPFSKLVLGHDAVIGKDRQGDRNLLTQLGEQFSFSTEYVEGYCLDEAPISSSRIRKCVADGQLAMVQQLLGRPYSIYGKVIPGAGKGRQIGFPTANIDIANLCCPPQGVYAVKVCVDKVFYPGIANLGIAPTFSNNRTVQLEVHLFDQELNLYGVEIEIVFNEFVRAEKKFPSIDALKSQIQADIEHVVNYHRETGI